VFRRKRKPTPNRMDPASPSFGSPDQTISNALRGLSPGDVPGLMLTYRHDCVTRSTPIDGQSCVAQPQGSRGLSGFPRLGPGRVK
jgi:hypothetical protein